MYEQFSDSRRNNSLKFVECHRTLVPKSAGFVGDFSDSTLLSPFDPHLRLCLKKSATHVRPKRMGTSVSGPIVAARACSELTP